MGAHFRVPIERLRRLQGRCRFAEGTAMHRFRCRERSLPMTRVDWTGPTTIVVGSEAHGASNALRDSATASVSIPMAAGVESLNAARCGLDLAFRGRTAASISA